MTDWTAWDVTEISPCSPPAAVGPVQDPISSYGGHIAAERERHVVLPHWKSCGRRRVMFMLSLEWWHLSFPSGGRGICPRICFKRGFVPSPPPPRFPACPKCSFQDFNLPQLDNGTKLKVGRGFIDYLFDTKTWSTKFLPCNELFESDRIGPLPSPKKAVPPKRKK